jgi:vitamin B12 transporter
MRDGDNRGTRTQLDWRQSFDLTDHTQLQLVTEMAQERFQSQRLGTMTNQGRSTHGGMGMAVMMAVTDAFDVTMAGRLDKYQAFRNAVTYRLASTYRVGQGRLKGSIGTGFKAPTLQQRFYKSPTFNGNATLQPEKSLGWDLGVEHTMFKEHLILGITVFQNHMHDIITGEGTTFVNRKKARTQGGEGVLTLQVTQDWKVDVSHTYIQAWDVETGLKLLRRPLHKSTLRLTGQVTVQWQVSGSVLYVGERDDLSATSFQRVRMPGYTLVGAETAYRLSDQWQIFGRGENLFNRRFEDPDGYHQPGFGIYAGVRAQW